MTKASDAASFYLTTGKIVQDLKSGTVTYDNVQVDGEKDVKTLAALQREQRQQGQSVQARTVSQARQREKSRAQAKTLDEAVKDYLKQKSAGPATLGEMQRLFKTYSQFCTLRKLDPFAKSTAVVIQEGCVDGSRQAPPHRQ